MTQTQFITQVRALAAPVVLAAGDRLALVAPTPADSTLADVLVALRGAAT